MDLKNLENIIKQLEVNKTILNTKIDTLKLEQIRALNVPEFNQILDEALNESTSIERLLELKKSVDIKCEELMKTASQFEEGLNSLVNSY